MLADIAHPKSPPEKEKKMFVQKQFLCEIEENG